MIQTPTVFILGAGASKPYGLPTGVELRDLLIEKLRGAQSNKGGPGIVLSELGHTDHEMRDFAESLQGSGQPSVDAFLAERDNFLTVGKRALAGYLIEMERMSHLTETTRDRRERAVRHGEAADQDDRWYDYVWTQMSDSGRDGITKNQVAFVTLNYDRPLEAYLTAAIRDSYGLTDPEAASILAEIPIIHVYGQLGKLHSRNAAEVRAYDQIVTSDSVLVASEQIVVMPEGDLDSPALEEASHLIQNARRVVFLGFGYHPENMIRLRMPQHVKSSPPNRFFGSASGLKRAEKTRISSSWQIKLGDASHKCRDYLREEIEL